MTELALRIVPRTWPRASTALALAVAVAFAAAYVRALTFYGEILPGTRVAGVEVGGVERQVAATVIQREVSHRLARPVTVVAGTTRIAVEPRDVFALNLVATTNAALAASRGREYERIGAVIGARTTDVEPVLTVREETARELLSRIRALGGRRPVPATVAMRGVEPVVTPGRAGARLDGAALLASLRAAALSGGDVEAVFERTLPLQRTSAARAAASTARDLVAAPVYVFFRGRPLRTFSPHQLAALVRFEERGERFVVGFDPRRAERLLAPAVREHLRAPVDARFVAAGARVRIVPSTPGIGLDLPRLRDQLAAAAYSPDLRVADVALREIQPAVTTQELAALGIRERISSFTTDMGVSSSNRIWNVHLMADYIDGTIIRPGATFSFNRVVGPRTVERGFREGQMIVGSLLLPSIGGGVCQTATTLFNNAFEIGLPIVRRYNHSFSISHYPLGRDATVSWGGPDLVFRNDLEHAILIKSSYTDATLTFTFYGRDPNRRVVSATSPQTNWRAPTTSYAYDAYAPSGTIRTSQGSNQHGFDVTVYRRVYEDGRLLRRDAFRSRYIPVGPTVVYGPGTNPPRIDFYLPKPEL